VLNESAKVAPGPKKIIPDKLKVLCHIHRTASQGTISVHKVVAVIPETHGACAPELLKIMKSSTGNVIGGMIVDGY
jgi:hypothetical protein